MDAEQTIAEIEWLERIFAEPDTRPLSASDLAAANRKHDGMLAHALIRLDFSECGGQLF
jgi:hypothetical protein